MDLSDAPSRRQLITGLSVGGEGVEGGSGRGCRGRERGGGGRGGKGAANGKGNGWMDGGSERWEVEGYGKEEGGGGKKGKGKDEEGGEEKEMGQGGGRTRRERVGNGVKDFWVGERGRCGGEWRGMGEGRQGTNGRVREMGAIKWG